jgi:GTP cyclohydrolase I
MKSAKAVVSTIGRSKSRDPIAESIEKILGALGEDPEREGLLRTPERGEKALRFLTSGYEANIEEIVNGAIFHEKCDEMVLVKDIEFFSLCEHHMLPFHGKAHVAYMPNHKIIGLSKIPRIVDMFARRLQVQERLTLHIAQCIQQVLQPRGVGVILEARHFCMMMRGVEKQHSGTVTSAMLGLMRSRKDTRDEFLSLVRHSSLST